MRISFLTPRLPPAQCGVGDHTALLAQALARLGVRVAYIHRHGTTVAHYALYGPVSRWKGTGASLLKCVAEQSSDWLWVQLSSYGYSRWGAPYRLGSAIARLRRTMPNVRLAVCVHETHCQPYQLGRKGPLLSPWQRYTIARVARLADLVLATIRPWCDRVIEDYGVPPTKVALLPIGSNIPAVSLTARGREQTRRKLGWRDGETVAVIFGSYPSQLQALERFGDLLREGVQQGYLERIVCLGGDGPARKHDFHASSWTERLGCEKDKFQVLGPRPGHEVGEILACCDLALAPTPRRLLSKSSAFMAFAAAGLAVIVYQEPAAALAAGTEDWPVFSSLEWRWSLVRSAAVRESARALQIDYRKNCAWHVIAQRAVALLKEATIRPASPSRGVAEAAFEASQVL